MKIYYDKYCKILKKKVITAAKKMAYDNYCMKIHNKMKATCKIINIGTGSSIKRDDTQYLIDKSCDQNGVETVNEYFLSLADKLANSAISSLGSSSDMVHLSFMEHGLKGKFPKICNKPVTIQEIEIIIYSFKTKDSCGYDLISLRILKLSTPYISSPLSYICNTIMCIPRKIKILNNKASS
jgi:hypothetical protein